VLGAVLGLTAKLSRNVVAAPLSERRCHSRVLQGSTRGADPSEAMPHSLDSRAADWTVSLDEQPGQQAASVFGDDLSASFAMLNVCPHS